MDPNLPPTWPTKSCPICNPTATSLTRGCSATAANLSRKRRAPAAWMTRHCRVGVTQVARRCRVPAASASETAASPMQLPESYSHNPNPSKPAPLGDTHQCGLSVNFEPLVQPAHASREEMGQQFYPVTPDLIRGPAVFPTPTGSGMPDQVRHDEVSMTGRKHPFPPRPAPPTSPRHGSSRSLV